MHFDTKNWLNKGRSDQIAKASILLRRISSVVFAFQQRVQQQWMQQARLKRRWLFTNRHGIITPKN
jgi:hypothetical protein